MTYTTTMTSKGQITVPAPIRKKLGIQPGASIDVKLKGNTAVFQLNDWQKGLTKIRADIAAQLKGKGIKLPVTDEDFRKLRQEAHKDAARDRYKRYQQTLKVN
ncbi:MAG: AbrB/MazE/SpoVT family DNA-binding domain-containing protein [Candidatus Saccharimonadales bacterium]